MGRKKLQSLDFPDPFQARRLPIVSAKSDFVSCRCHAHPANNIRGDAEKTLDLKLQTWTAYSSYVGQDRVRVRVKARVNLEEPIGYPAHTRLIFLSVCPSVHPSVRVEYKKNIDFECRN
jgi:hypothetical protein